MDPWIWASLALLAVLFEVAVTDLTGFGLALGALFGAGAALLGLSLSLQVIAASFGLLLFVFLLRPWFVTYRRKKTTVLTHDLVGTEGWLFKGIEEGSPGSVKVRGELWMARSEQPIPAETTVLITAVDGATLTVIAK